MFSFEAAMMYLSQCCVVLRGKVCESRSHSQARGTRTCWTRLTIGAVCTHCSYMLRLLLLCPACYQAAHSPTHLIGSTHAQDVEAVKRVLPKPGLNEMMCYNQKRDFQCWIPRQQHDSEELAKLIRSSGLAGGLKAYFKAFVDQATQQLVVVPTMLPAQPW